MNNNLLVYGSFSRGDFTSDSDVDLLTVIEGNSYKSIHNKINISYYDKTKLTEMSTSGSLFVFHLNKEAKVLIDENAILNEIIFNKFILKKNYYEDVAFSRVLLTDIIERYDESKNYSFANSRVSWCLRTFYAGMGANQNIPIFSKEKISSQFGKEAITFLDLKNHETYQKKLILKITKHLDKFSNINKAFEGPFRADLNAFRVDVIKSLQKEYQDEFDGY